MVDFAVFRDPIEMGARSALAPATATVIIVNGHKKTPHHHHSFLFVGFFVARTELS